MGSETIAFDILLVFLCINGGLLMVGTAFPDTILRSPFDLTAEITGVRTGMPSEIYNATTGAGIQQNVTSGSAQNSTIGGTPATLNPVESLFFPIAILWEFITFVSNLVPVINLLNTLGMPAMFVYTVTGVIGILSARMAIYWVWGR